ncbi:hypothetical protein NOR_07461 [Metarhizium rileyi]|uniref:Uncharacterized protein n=1 Tax=Metarhizium rileyi (strain RCEF 4871) TaxID=1649241 RepID=A0A166Y9A0_METRR|nr:hypothetical protein NOR_07461 [Metarhizium rileyi RCEF 4871]
MHVLGNIGHSFSQRRRTHKPKDLHIRKVSCSGSSLSSGCSSSSSSASSTSTARPPLSARTTASSSTFYDPLSSHPTFQPPPRLHDRPLISPERPDYQHAVTFFDGSTDDEFDHQSIGDEEEYTIGKAQALHFSHPTEMVLSPLSPSTDHASLDSYSGQQPLDYFMMQMAKRPPMPRSRWSESTIQTQDLDLDLSADELDQTTPDLETDLPLEIPNFSLKRNVTATPKRPPMRSLDSLEDLIKRSGWKRRGVVFNRNETEEDA